MESFAFLLHIKIKARGISIFCKKWILLCCFPRYPPRSPPPTPAVSQIQREKLKSRKGQRERTKQVQQSWKIMIQPLQHLQLVCNLKSWLNMELSVHPMTCHKLCWHLGSSLKSLFDCPLHLTSYLTLRPGQIMYVSVDLEIAQNLSGLCLTFPSILPPCLPVFLKPEKWIVYALPLFLFFCFPVSCFQISSQRCELFMLSCLFFLLILHVNHIEASTSFRNNWFAWFLPKVFLL